MNSSNTKLICKKMVLQFFPSLFLFPHRVTIPTKGTRYSAFLGHDK